MTSTLLILMLACTGEPQPNLGPSPTAEPAAKARIDAPEAEHRTEKGWGAMFWRNGTAWKVGGGLIVVGPKRAAKVRTAGETLACDGVATKGAPPHGAVVLPLNSPIPTVPQTPAIQAHRVERAAWRLDEVLPPQGRFASRVTSTSPSKQRGVEVGSVTKTRRRGAPPILIATGVRDCTGVVTLTDLKAEGVIVYDRLPHSCKPLRVLPALDYDGDGQREFAVFSDERVAIYRLTEGPGRLGMTRLADFRCADNG